jgi:MFS family permease
MMTSLCTRYWQFLLAQGILGGFCAGMCFSPSTAIIGHYFRVKRPMVMGIAASGSALGGVLFPIMLQRLLQDSTLGFGWSVRVLGFLVLPLAITASLTLRAGVPPRRGSYFIPSAFKSATYGLQIAGLFLLMMAIFTPFFYIPTYAEAHGMSTRLSFYLIAILNGASFFGRIGSGLLSLKLGAFNMMNFFCLACAVLIFAWLGITSHAALIVFAMLFGIFSGGVIGLLPVTMSMTAPNPSVIGTYMGMGMGLVGFAGLVGPPITGALVRSALGYHAAIYFAGGCAVLGTILVVAARLSFSTKVIA